jgi:hypothetical protein
MVIMVQYVESGSSWFLVRVDCTAFNDSRACQSGLKRLVRQTDDTMYKVPHCAASGTTIFLDLLLQTSK